MTSAKLVRGVLCTVTEKPSAATRCPAEQAPQSKGLREILWEGWSAPRSPVWSKPCRRVALRRLTKATCFMSYNDPRLHFGLGHADVVERVEVRWPSGARDVLHDVPADQLITIVEGGSR